MQIVSNEPVDSRPLQPWVRPTVARIVAGSAELNVTGADDGPNQVS